MMSFRRPRGCAGAISMSDVHRGSVVKYYEHDRFDAKSWGLSRRERDVKVGLVHLETRIIKESTWQWRYKAYGDLGAVFCDMGERVVCLPEGMETLEQH